MTQRILKKFKLDPHDSNICPFNLHPEQTEETHTFCRNLSLHLIQDLHGWAMPSSMIFGNTSLIRGFLSRSSQVVKFSEALKDVKLVKMNENRFEYFVARILVSDFFSRERSWVLKSVGWVSFCHQYSNFVITNYFKIIQ